MLVGVERGDRQRQDVLWHTDQAVDYFSAWHRGYSRTRKATVTRKIFFVKPHFWVIHDRVDLGKGGGAKAASWYLHSCNRFASRQNGWSTSGAKAGLTALPVDLPSSAHFETALESRLAPDEMEQEMYLNYYPDRYFLRLRQRITPTTRHRDFCFVLYPQRKADRRRVSTESVPVFRDGKRVASGEAQAFTVSCGKQTHLVYLNHSDPDATASIQGTDVVGRAAVQNLTARNRRWTAIQ